MQNIENPPLLSAKSKIPDAVFQKVAAMEPVNQDAFVEEFRRKSKSTGVAYAFWILGSFLGLHYLYFGKPLLFFLFLITFGGFCIWWIGDAFRIPGIIREHNRSVALNVLRDIQVLK